eukprot:scaffold1890_cov380-Prasinococcus_capsulatus_cf.AAC.4
MPRHTSGDRRLFPFRFCLCVSKLVRKHGRGIGPGTIPAALGIRGTGRAVACGDLCCRVLNCKVHSLPGIRTMVRSYSAGSA